jgi:hypothetical protein
MYQAHQPVKITAEGDDLGRAGTIRGTVKTDDHGDFVIPVQLDGDDAPRLFPVDSIQPL